jgi:Fe-S cluster assembly scaffold protein SufB
MRKIIRRTVRGDLDQKFLVQADGDTVLQVKFLVKHDRPRTSSRIAIGILASQRARVAVDATTIISPSAPDTKAWLEIRAVVCDDAEVTAAPNLEISNNAVQAGHALTTKQVTADELFYLMSRGLERASAERLIIEATLAPFREGVVIQ